MTEAPTSEIAEHTRSVMEIADNCCCEADMVVYLASRISDLMSHFSLNLYPVMLSDDVIMVLQILGEMSRIKLDD